MTGQLLALVFKYLFSIYFTIRRLGIPFTKENVRTLWVQNHFQLVDLLFFLKAVINA